MRYLTIDSILYKLSSEVGNLSYSEEDAIEWIGHCLGLMGSPVKVIDKVIKLKIRGYTCQMPRDVLNIVSVEYNGHKLYRGTEQECLHGTKSYTVQGDIGFQSIRLYNIPSGEITLRYNALPLDSKDNLPLIPDDSLFIEAITNYVKMKISERNLWQGRAGADRLLQFYKREWETYRQRAVNKGKGFNDEDGMKRFIDVQSKMFPDPSL